ncbi:MAG: DNA translocase FtsK 4TM domain-containing protein, partial [Polaribacter sp.]|nr:DNA translocase FtsK 4TM domain-containing protein [Polaribacter sp.]
MAKKTTTPKKPKFQSIKAFVNNRQTQTVFGVFLILFSLFLSIAFFSFFFSWQEDQSTLTQFADKTIISENLLGKVGAKLSHFFIFDGFGVAAFILPGLLFITGFYGLFKIKLQRIVKNWNWGLLIMLWFSISFGFASNTLFSGIIGFEINEYLQAFLGKTGLTISLSFIFITYLIIRFKISPEGIVNTFRSKKEDNENSTELNIPASENSDEIVADTETSAKSEFELSVEDLQPTIDKHSEVSSTKKIEEEQEEDKTLLDIVLQESDESTTSEDIGKKEEDVTISVDTISEEKHVKENLSDKLLKDFGEFDPTLELGNFKFPTFNLLKEYNETISIDPEELEANKNKILKTLQNYKIGISKIKATVGPTITLYEIVPEAGVRISKIKNLEDDIALSLSALGIRIIAPIPGKGTIGIEVPNKKATIVSMHSVISSSKFQKSQMELPIALGKTISNETFVIDLAKMPHLLMAGATGQGKSVGLNAVLTSLLYKKHPAEVKFVLVDPKKVELTLFNKIERHYLAKLPDSEDAI